MQSHSLHYVCLNVLIFLLLQLLSVPVYSEEAGEKYNVLFIMSDDLNTDISSYGHPLVKTPNIDRLARRGVQFNRAYNQYPLCSPSRTSLLTGLSPDLTGVYAFGIHFREHVPGVVTLPQLFKNNGYYSARVGKIFHYGLDDPESWSEVVPNPRGRDLTQEARNRLVNLMPGVDGGVSMAYLAADGTDEEHTDGMTATEGIRLLQQNKDTPFFIAVGFYRPHVPFVAPKKYFDMYPLDQIVLPKEPEDVMKGIPSAALYTKPANWGLSEAERREAIRGYYASISFMDAQVGRLLDELDSLKLAETTIVVFLSDHGYKLGEHGGQWQKRSLFERGARAPLIIAVPEGEGSRGRECDRIVEFVDLYPTLADLANLPVKQVSSGESLKPLLRNPDANWDNVAYTQVGISRFATPRGMGITELMGYEPARQYPENSMGKSARDERWRYTEWDKGRLGMELYDYERDPHELNNLAYDQEYREQVKRFSRLIEDHFRD